MAFWPMTTDGDPWFRQNRGKVKGSQADQRHLPSHDPMEDPADMKCERHSRNRAPHVLTSVIPQA